MKYYVKNPSGGVSTTTEKIYNRLLANDEYECWTVDPYENLPPEVEEVLLESADYPVDNGAGWYELSDGSTVRGKDKAIEQQKALDDG